MNRNFFDFWLPFSRWKKFEKRSDRRGFISLEKYFQKLFWKSSDFWPPISRQEKPFNKLVSILDQFDKKLWRYEKFDEKSFTVGGLEKEVVTVIWHVVLYKTPIEKETYFVEEQFLVKPSKQRDL